MRILLDVDASDLFRFLGVNRSFDSTIRGSPALQTKMYPSEPDYGMDFTVAPLLPDFITVRYEFLQPMGHSDAYVKKRVKHRYLCVTRFSSINPPSGSWEQILMVQPPVRLASSSLDCESRGTFLDGTWAANRTLTLGVLLEHARDLWRTHSCGRIQTLSSTVSVMFEISVIPPHPTRRAGSKDDEPQASVRFIHISMNVFPTPLI